MMLPSRTTSLVALLAVSATLVQAQQSSGCLVLTGSKACPDYQQYAVKAIDQFKSVQDFDNFVFASFDNNTAYQSQFQSFFDCPNWKGSGERFHISVVCTFLVAQSQCQQPAPWTPLCQESCNLYLSSLNAVFANPASCNQNTTSQFSQRRGIQSDLQTSAYAQYCTTLPKNSTGAACTTGMKFEATQCGFFNTTDAQAYCSSASGSNDPCCPPFVNQTLQSESKILLPIDPKVWIISASVLGVMILGVVFYLVCIRTGRWKKKRAQAFVPLPEETSPAGMSGSGSMLGSASTQRKSLFNSDGRRSLFNGLRSNPNGRISVFSRKSKINVASDFSRPDMEALPVPMFVPPVPSLPSTSQRTNMRMKVIESYTPMMTDEVALRLNDIILVEEMYDDGWAIGQNETNGGSGAFPMACVAPLSSAPQEARASPVQQRTNSLMATPRS
ncbi:uncharacterized protein BJ171DRAFT_502508 [Polychytrium aggregatum]|uniref:uncharacterized protein n=1 Tax=Polychytrium aggregatum TaxID=110093 RepID=UPI0022FE64C8|nr:uncharacterized protein BJ171DRAFT_502508 [Polychytrium aggregatum]KAI9204968.1 hypothetical protein BJ171DRAFT_502508 [Polychytrium aggregatum]